MHSATAARLHVSRLHTAVGAAGAAGAARCRRHLVIILVHMKHSFWLWWPVGVTVDKGFKRFIKTSQMFQLLVIDSLVLPAPRGVTVMRKSEKVPLNICLKYHYCVVPHYYTI